MTDAADVEAGAQLVQDAVAATREPDHSHDDNKVFEVTAQNTNTSIAMRSNPVRSCRLHKNGGANIKDANKDVRVAKEAKCAPSKEEHTLKQLEVKLATDESAFKNAKRKYEATLSEWQKHPTVVKQRRKQAKHALKEAIDAQMTEMWWGWHNECSMHDLEDANAWFLQKGEHSVSSLIRFSWSYRDILMALGARTRYAEYEARSGETVSIEWDPLDSFTVECDDETALDDSDMQQITSPSTHWNDLVQSIAPGKQDRHLHLAMFLIRYRDWVWLDGEKKNDDSDDSDSD